METLAGLVTGGASASTVMAAVVAKGEETPIEPLLVVVLLRAASGAVGCRLAGMKASKAWAMKDLGCISKEVVV